MSRDGHFLSSKKIHVFDGELLSKIREIYPLATQEGSTGSYSFFLNGEVVGEAWLHRKSGWWLRIKEKIL